LAWSACSICEAIAVFLSALKTAIQLRVAQPALNRQIQDLEEGLGMDLIRRSPDPARLRVGLKV
jgi:DNA-binding transcriptional LysR family regulator